MEDHLLWRLRSRRSTISREWERLLRTEPVETPLGNPDTLVHLIDRTLDEVFIALRAPDHPHPAVRHSSYRTFRKGCECGRNPLLAYFLAGERALMEALVLEQVHSRVLPHEARDMAVAELYVVLRAIARRDVEAFCSLCLHRHASPSRASSMVDSAHL
jgi:hypothetical protein